MNHYEAKQEARRERLATLATRKAQEAETLSNRARKMGDLIPFGQPILVGHHSEGRDRRYRGRIQSTFEKSHEAHLAAEHYAGRAAAVGSAGVSADDPEATAKLREQLVAAEVEQERMVAGNRVYRSKKLTDDGKVAQLVALGLEERHARGRLAPDYAGRIGFAGYELTNNGANIRRLKERIESLEREAVRRPEESTTTERVGYSVTEDPEENRLLLRFAVRAPEAVCKLLKSHGFRWAPSRGAWSRQLNDRSRATEQYLRPDIEGALTPSV